MTDSALAARTIRLQPGVIALMTILMLAISAVSAFPVTFATEKLAIHKADGTRHEFTVEIASESEQRAQGLMFRRTMANDAGMLFDYGMTRPVYMWMKNTHIPLDMLFVRQDGTIATIKANTEPFSEAVIDSREPVHFVIELNAGTAASLGISVGDRADSPQIRASQRKL